MKKITGFFVPLAVLVAMATPGFAELRYRLEFYGAVMAPQEKTFTITVPQSTVPLNGSQTFSIGARGGVRVGTDGKGHWGQDFIYSYGTNPSKIVNKVNNSQFAFTSRIHQFSYNALWFPLKSGLDRKNGSFPYLTAGVGGSFHVLSQATINAALNPNGGGLGQLHNENVLDVNFGGGVLFRMGGRFGIRVDARDYMSRAIRYGLPKESSDPQATVFPVGGVFHRIEGSVALVIYF